jgi:glutathione synthase/RimK-type ligase-like ATP-grasp enzyme
MGWNVVKIAYVTYDGPDDDREVLLATWQQAGIEGTAVPWDDPAADWASFDAAVIRSTWNYVYRRHEFVDWAYKAASVTRLLNPAAVLERNTDKTYLRDFERFGIPIVPTHWVTTDDELSLPDWDDYVVKPTVSSGARDTIRTADTAEAEAHAKKLVTNGRVAMVQPYLDMVEAEGETSLIYFGGAFSHAMRRNAMLAGGTAAPRANHLGAALRDPASDQLELAGQVLGAVPEEILYARVDLVRLADGTPVLIELELTEPYFYLSYAPSASDRFTTALRNLL